MEEDWFRVYPSRFRRLWSRDNKALPMFGEGLGGVFYTYPRICVIFEQDYNNDYPKQYARHKYLLAINNSLNEEQPPYVKKSIMANNGTVEADPSFIPTRDWRI